MKKNKWFVLVIAIVVFLFYWFQLRPSAIRKYCAGRISFSDAITGDDTYYQKCLHEKGLK